MMKWSESINDVRWWRNLYRINEGIINSIFLPWKRRKEYWKFYTFLWTHHCKIKEQTIYLHFIKCRSLNYVGNWIDEENVLHISVSINVSPFRWIDLWNRIVYTYICGVYHYHIGLLIYAYGRSVRYTDAKWILV